MTDRNAQERLLEFLDRKAFEPVLNASPDDYRKEEDRKKLEHAQRATRTTQQRYHESYTTAGEVFQNFKGNYSAARPGLPNPGPCGDEKDVVRPAQSADLAIRRERLNSYLLGRSQL